LSLTRQIASKGFTLAELLIALAILGEIATFTIPKILSSQQNSQRIAVFKETIGALSEITYYGYLQGDLTTSNVTSYYASKLNTVKICSTNSFTQGCWSHPGGDTEPGFVLHNGATLTGFNNTGPGNGISMDWNGAAGPNIEGQDIIQLQICFGSPCWYGARAGTVWTYSATSETMFQTIFN
jgi:prepilin-type N-terminal cleavage/methylation domain-containing protein